MPLPGDGPGSTCAHPNDVKKHDLVGMALGNYLPGGPELEGEVIERTDFNRRSPDRSDLGGEMVALPVNIL